MRASSPTSTPRQTGEHRGARAGERAGMRAGERAGERVGERGACECGARERTGKRDGDDCSCSGDCVLVQTGEFCACAEACCGDIAGAAGLEGNCGHLVAAESRRVVGETSEDDRAGERTRAADACTEAIDRAGDFSRLGAGRAEAGSRVADRAGERSRAIDEDDVAGELAGDPARTGAEEAGIAAGDCEGDRTRAAERWTVSGELLTGAGDGSGELTLAGERERRSSLWDGKLSRPMRTGAAGPAPCGAFGTSELGSGRLEDGDWSRAGGVRLTLGSRGACITGLGDVREADARGETARACASAFGCASRLRAGSRPPLALPLAGCFFTLAGRRAASVARAAAAASSARDALAAAALATDLAGLGAAPLTGRAVRNGSSGMWKATGAGRGSRGLRPAERTDGTAAVVVEGAAAATFVGPDASTAPDLSGDSATCDRSASISHPSDGSSRSVTSQAPPCTSHSWSSRGSSRPPGRTDPAGPSLSSSASAA
jgi:hypothetical protein